MNIIDSITAYFSCKSEIGRGERDVDGKWNINVLPQDKK